jgi:hypothetical protein
MSITRAVVFYGVDDIRVNEPLRPVAIPGEVASLVTLTTR